jgi:hypothetical protein
MGAAAGARVRRTQSRQRGRSVRVGREWWPSCERTLWQASAPGAWLGNKGRRMPEESTGSATLDPSCNSVPLKPAAIVKAVIVHVLSGRPPRDGPVISRAHLSDSEFECELRSLGREVDVELLDVQANAAELLGGGGVRDALAACAVVLVVDSRVGACDARDQTLPLRSAVLRLCSLVRVSHCLELRCLIMTVLLGLFCGVGCKRVPTSPKMRLCGMIHIGLTTKEMTAPRTRTPQW